MSQPTIPFLIEPMTLADIPEVVAIEQASYSMTWPEKAYDYELQKNKLAHYFVLRVLPQQTNQSTDQPASPIIGLAGFWLMSDEIHINTIAIHPNWRRLGLGEWLLIKLLEEGQALDARVATLEVRPSNQAALALYQKYKFKKVGRRRHYYSNNGEDALILTTPALNLPDYQAMFRQRQAALDQRLAQIKIDKTGQMS